MALDYRNVGAPDRAWIARGLRHTLALLLICATACVSSARMPNVAANRVLTPGLVPSGSVDQQPFRVVFAGPRGEAAEVSAVSVVFNRPLRELTPAAAQSATDAGGSSAPPPVTITPRLAGAWQWVGTQALIFVPASGRLAGATHYRVEVPAGTRALDGSTLGRSHAFEFTTPRPKLVRSNPYSGDTTLEPNASFQLFFNQVIELRALERALSLTATSGGKATRLEYRLARPDAREPKRVRLVPSKPLPVASAISLRIADGLRSQEGPLPSGAASELSFRTYGPLVVERYECDRETPQKRCAPGSSLSFAFSNLVKLADVRRALSVTPPVKLRY
ncbi:MAG TPA: Ig-like domain-containing protein, partial [Polyangiaceae bacterium]|nr:Ig-like domain-containing protein [Polyangiaceae bacterium]